MGKIRWTTDDSRPLRVAVDGRRSRHVTQKRVQFQTYELFLKFLISYFLGNRTKGKGCTTVLDI